jgi:hypothetical protein
MEAVSNSLPRGIIRRGFHNDLAGADVVALMQLGVQRAGILIGMRRQGHHS